MKISCAATRCTRSFEYTSGNKHATATAAGFNTYLDQSSGLDGLFLCEEHSDRMKRACDIIVDVVGVQRARTSLIGGGMASFVYAAIKEREAWPTAVCALVRYDGKWLAVSRKGDPGDMGLPGGKVEPGEQPWAACVRELKEETGLTFGRGPHEVFRAACGDFDVATYYMGIYVPEFDAGKLLPESGTSVQWLTELELTHPRNSFANYNWRLFEALKSKDLF